MQDTTYSKTVANATNFFEVLDYYAKYGAALFPVPFGQKAPFGIVSSFKHDFSRDPEQWARWSQENPGCNFGVVGFASNWIICDIDTSGGEAGRAEALTLWSEVCASWGLPPLLGHVRSARGGFHVYFQVPAGVDASTLRQPDAIKDRINIRCVGYTIAAGSYYDGTAKGEESGTYTLFPDAGPPYPAPTALVEHCTRAAPRLLPNSVPDSFDNDDLAAMLRWMAERGMFEAYEDWYQAGMALKIHGDGSLWDLCHDGSVTPSQAASKWESFSSEPTADSVTIASLMKRAHDAKWTGSIRRSAASMFDGVARLAAEAGASLVPEQGVSMMSGGAVWQPKTAPPEYSEIEVADRFANGYATNLRYIKARGSWIYWDGKCWHVDDTDHVANLARLHCKAESGLCAGTPNNTNAQARALCSDKTVRAVLRLAAVDPRIASTVGAWDQDPWLLGTPDGIVDLRDGTFRAACPEDHVTKGTAVSPKGDCPQWLAFLHRATDGDVDVQSYLQRLCGYALTGSTREQSLYFASGPGGGGKGTLMHAVSSILHDYHVVTAIATLTDTKFDRHPAEVAALQGARLVTCSETERGRHWAESRIKEWTGGDPISARFMNQNFFTFTPTFKLLISGNYKPHMRPDTAMRRRFQLIPFKTAIPKSEQDPKLGAKLEKEWPGILGWMIAGAVEWRRVGLCPPSAVLDATNEYMDEEAEDVLSAWLHERCEVDPKAESLIGELYGSYKRYAEQAGEKVMTNATLGKELKRLDFKSRRTDRERYVVGIKLAPPTEPTRPLPPLPY